MFDVLALAIALCGHPGQASKPVQSIVQTMRWHWFDNWEVDQPPTPKPKPAKKPKK